MEHAVAVELARLVTLRPEGFALVAPGPMHAAAWAALLRMVGGAAWAPASAAVGRLAATPRAATLGGVRVLPAGRVLPGGWLVVREAAAMAPAVAAMSGAVWDHRFRLGAAAEPPAGSTVGALGADAARLRHVCDLPDAVLTTLPALRVGGALLAVPLLGWPEAAWRGRCPMLFAPPEPAAAAAFVALRAPMLAANETLGMHAAERRPMF